MERTHKLTPGQMVLSELAGPLDRRAFESLSASLFAELVPYGEMEALTVEQIVAAHWTLRRCLAAEARLAAVKGVDPLCDECRHPALRGIESVVRRAERTIERSLKLLRQLQTERELRRVVEPSASLTPEERKAVQAPLADYARIRHQFLRYRQGESNRGKHPLQRGLEELSRRWAAEGELDEPSG